MLLCSTQQISDAPRLVVVFGVGLVGRAIWRSLQQECSWHTENTPILWGDATSENAALECLHKSLQSAHGSLDVVWSAGKCGFGALSKDAEAEYLIFRRMLTRMSGLANDAARPATFHLVSSAGGLFEGQRNVLSDDFPNPTRPYGELKLKQETFLRSIGGFSSTNVYRPSSIYGAIGDGRSGLIATAVGNGIAGRVTVLSGSANTLRDYVFVEDVGSHIARTVFHDTNGISRTDFLVSGKPTSIVEVQATIERVLKRKIFVAIQQGFSNSDDITFQHSVPAPGFANRSLATGIKYISSEWVNSGRGLS